MSVLGKAMESEIREQPEVLQQGAVEYFPKLREHLHNKSFDLVVLVARGSSDHAALYARYLIEVFLGVPVSLSAPSVITRYQADVRYRKALAIGISQSGAAPDVAEVLRHLRADGHATLGITNTPRSPITEAAEMSLYLGAGKEVSVPATKTYTATLLALYEAVRAMGGLLPEPALQLPTEDWTALTMDSASAHASKVVAASPVFCLGRGFSFPSALEGALKLMESALVLAKGYSTADFEHGPRALAGEDSAAVVYGKPPGGLEEQGCPVLPCPDPTYEVVEPILPIWQAFYAQWLALLAARLRGIDPDQPQFIRKVTRTR